MPWAPSDKSSLITLSNSDRTATRTGTSDTFQSVRSTYNARGSKRYCEMYIDSAASSNFIIFGLANSSMGLTSMGPGVDANGWSYYQQTGQKYHSNSLSTYGSSYTNGDVIGMAYDPAAGKVWFAKNNTWQASGDPAAGSNPAFTGLSSDLYAAVGLYRSTAPAHVITGRFVSADFSYSPPSGFSEWDEASSGGASVTISGVASSGSAGVLALTAGGGVTLLGAGLSGSAGALSLSAAAALSLLGVAGAATAGGLSLSAGAQATLIGVGGDGAVGTVTVSAGATASITLTGVASIGHVGTITLSASAMASIALTGVASIGGVGTVALSAGALAALSGALAQGWAGSLRMVEVITPGGRLIVIESDDRTLILTADDRMLLIDPDDRLLLMQPDDSNLNIN